MESAQVDPPPTAPAIDWSLAMRRLSTACLIAAVAVVAWPIGTSVWAGQLERQRSREGDRLLESRVPKRVANALERGLEALSDGDGADGMPSPRDQERIRRAATVWRSDRAAGDPLGRLSIPRTGLSVVFVQGSRRLQPGGRDDTLQAGPAHIPWSSLPGMGGNTGIAGHRTTYTRPFWSLHRLRRGDRIVLRMPYGRFTYRVIRVHEVQPTNVDVAKPHGYEEITLSTCTPRFTAVRRLVVHARIDEMATAGWTADD